MSDRPHGETIRPEDGHPPVLCDSLLLGVTGSPAALAMPHYVLLMRQVLATTVRVMMTAAAQRFLPAYTMRLHSGNWVYTDTHEVADGVYVPHIELTRDIDLLLIMPATVDSIAKAAAGLCDDLVSTAVVASPAPVVFVPAMNATMWSSRVVQRNVQTAVDLGYHVLDPGIGLQLADHQGAVGAMRPLEQMLDELIAIVGASDRKASVASW